MGIQFDTVRTLQTLCLVTFTLLIKDVQLNGNIWIIAGNTSVLLRMLLLLWLFVLYVCAKANKNKSNAKGFQYLLFPVAKYMMKICVYFYSKAKKDFRWWNEKKTIKTFAWNKKSIEMQRAAYIFEEIALILLLISLFAPLSLM